MDQAQLVTMSEPVTLSEAKGTEFRRAAVLRVTLPADFPCYWVQ